MRETMILLLIDVSINEWKCVYIMPSTMPGHAVVTQVYQMPDYHENGYLCHYYNNFSLLYKEHPNSSPSLKKFEEM